MKKLLLALAAAAALFAGPAFAVNCSGYSYTLTNGTTANATQVMANFNNILSCANNNLAHNAANSDITSLSGLTTPLSAAQGGTGQATSIFSSANAWAGVQTFTLAPVFTDVSGSRTALGLGTASTQNTGTSGANLPFLNGINTWAAAQTFTVAPVFTDASGSRTALGLGTASTQNTGTSGANLPFLNGNNTWGGTNAFTTAPTVGGLGFGPWTQIAATTPGGGSTTVAFTGISTAYTDLLVVLESVIGTTNFSIAFGDATPTYSSDIVFTNYTGSGNYTGAVLIPNIRNSYGMATTATVESVAGASPWAAGATAGSVAWRVTSGVRAVKITAASFGGAGTIRLYGR